jgi:hypothetical protein
MWKTPGQLVDIFCPTKGKSCADKGLQKRLQVDMYKKIFYIKACYIYNFI